MMHTTTTLAVNRAPGGGVTGGRIAAGLSLWLAAVAAASAAGVFEGIARASAPAYGLVIALMIGSALALYLTWGTLARTVDAVPMRTLTLFHAPRIVGGLAFLAYGAQGSLSPLFAAFVGWGDIVAGLAALLVLVVRAPRPWLLAGIHLIGLADLANGLATGMTLGLLGDQRLLPIAQLPLSLIVLFWVPLLVVSHVAALRRLWRDRRGASGG